MWDQSRESIRKTLIRESKLSQVNLRRTNWRESLTRQPERMWVKDGLILVPFVVSLLLTYLTSVVNVVVSFKCQARIDSQQDIEDSASPTVWFLSSKQGCVSSKEKRDDNSHWIKGQIDGVLGMTENSSQWYIRDWSVFGSEHYSFIFGRTVIQERETWCYIELETACHLYPKLLSYALSSFFLGLTSTSSLILLLRFAKEEFFLRWEIEMEILSTKTNYSTREEDDGREWKCREILVIVMINIQEDEETCQLIASFMQHKKEEVRGIRGREMKEPSRRSIITRETPCISWVIYRRLSSFFVFFFVSRFELFPDSLSVCIP
jgi:hypothetical protein